MLTRREEVKTLERSSSFENKRKFDIYQQVLKARQKEKERIETEEYMYSLSMLDNLDYRMAKSARKANRVNKLKSLKATESMKRLIDKD